MLSQQHDRTSHLYSVIVDCIKEQIDDYDVVVSMIRIIRSRFS